MAKPKPQTEDPPNGDRAPLVIEHVDPATLSLDPENPRKISDDQRARLMRGMEKFGMPVPLLARREDRVVIGGHQRLSIALALGWTSVPVIFREGLTRSEARALSILLNNSKAQGEWDADLLSGWLGALKAEDFDLTLTGFNAADVAALTKEAVIFDAFPQHDETIETDYQCPSCNYAWSGKPK